MTLVCRVGKEIVQRCLSLSVLTVDQNQIYQFSISLSIFVAAELYIIFDEELGVISDVSTPSVLFDLIPIGAL